MIFAELKIAGRALHCIRQALGQLLEYAEFGRSSQVAELWIIGTHPCTDAERAYLETLRQIISLRVYYRRYDEAAGILGERM
jgi:hypothetical protein